MRQLRFLDIGFLRAPFFQIYASNNLEILRTYDLGHGDVRDFSELINLRELELKSHGNDRAKNVEKLLKCISNFPKLKHARISALHAKAYISETGTEILAQLFSSDLQTLDLRVPLGKLPEYDSQFFRSLEDLRLEDCGLEEDPMEILEKLPKLQRLWLCDGSFRGREMVCHSMGFIQLRFLQLHNLYSLRKWTVEKSAMPKLCHLEIDFCFSLEMIPEGLRFIKSLKELVIKDMPNEFGNRIRVVDGQKGEDLDKVCHIPSIMFMELQL